MSSLIRVGLTAFAFFFVLPGEMPALCASFRDSRGQEIRLESPPQRIIPLAPSLTEILYALGVGDRVVGVTQFSHYPPEAGLKPKVGSYINLNVEKIISLGPDLVIGTVDGNEPGTVRMLKEAGIRVFLLDPRDLSQIIASVAILGRVCGVPETGDCLAARLQERVNRVLEKTASRKRPLVFLQINIQPIMSVSRTTYHHDLIRLAGGINMTGDEPQNYPRINLEEVLRRKPEVILISSMARGGRFEKALREWMKWPSIPAVRNNRVYLIDSDLIDRPSLRIVSGLEAMARFIHPDAGWD